MPDMTSCGAAKGRASGGDLKSIMAMLTDDDLVRLEDELNFEHFTGVPSPMMLDIVARVSEAPALAA